MSGARILIVTSSPLCRNPRVLKEAGALAAAGHDVTVLAPANGERFEKFDREILRSAAFRKITLATATSDRAATWLARQGNRLGIQSGASFGPAGALCRRARGLPADLTIVHTELGLVVGADLLAHGRRVATDFEDWHSRDLLPRARRYRPRRLLLRLEARMMRHSSYTSAPSEAMAAALDATYGGSPPWVIRNVFPLQPAPAASPRPGPPAFFWFSQTIGPGRMLEPFLAAWAMTSRPSRLCLLGDISPEYREKLVSQLPLGRRSALEFLPLVSPGELPGMIARHDIGLALEPRIPENKDLTISNKLFQYFNAGLGVLASDTAGQMEALRQAPGAGRIISLTDAASLAATLDGIIGDPGAIAAMGAAARRAAVEKFCWEKEKSCLLDAVSAALESRAP